MTHRHPCRGRGAQTAQVQDTFAQGPKSASSSDATRKSRLELICYSQQMRQVLHITLAAGNSFFPSSASWSNTLGNSLNTPGAFEIGVEASGALVIASTAMVKCCPGTTMWC